MHKPYKKYSNSAVFLVDPRTVDKKANLFLNELGAQFRKISTKSGEIAFYENQATVKGKKLKGKQTHFHESRYRYAGDEDDHVKSKPARHQEQLEKNLNQEKRHRKTRNENAVIKEANIDRNSPSRKTKKQAINHENSDNFKHLYEDSKTEIYFVNDNIKKSRKKKLKSSGMHTDRLSKDIDKEADYQKIVKNATAKKMKSKEPQLKAEKQEGTFSTKFFEYFSKKQPITVATLSDLEQLFFSKQTHQDKSETRNKKRPQHFEGEHQSAVFQKPHKHKRTNRDREQFMEDNDLDYEELHDRLLDLKHEERKESHKNKTDTRVKIDIGRAEHKNKNKHRSSENKDEKINLLLVDKYSKHSKKSSDNKKEDTPSSPKSLFQNLHVNFGKCILMEDRNDESNPKAIDDILSHELPEKLEKEHSRRHKSKRSKNESRKFERKHRSDSEITSQQVSSTSTKIDKKITDFANSLGDKPSKLIKDVLNHKDSSFEIGFVNFDDPKNYQSCFMSDIPNQFPPVSLINQPYHVAMHEPLTEKKPGERHVFQTDDLAFLKELLSYPEHSEFNKMEKICSPRQITISLETNKPCGVEGTGDHNKRLTKNLGAKKLKKTDHFCLFDSEQALQKHFLPSSRISSPRKERCVVYCDDTVEIESRHCVGTQKSIDKRRIIDGYYNDIVEDAVIQTEEVLIKTCEPSNSNLHIDTSQKEDEALDIYDEMNIAINAGLMVEKDYTPARSGLEILPEFTVDSLKESETCASKRSFLDRQYKLSTITFQIEDISSGSINKFSDNDHKKTPRQETDESGKRHPKLVKTVFKIIEINPEAHVNYVQSKEDETSPLRMKPAIKKVSFPDVEVEEIVERKKKSPVFRRYYQYTNEDSPTRIETQTCDTNFLSDYNDAVNDSWEAAEELAEEKKAFDNNRWTPDFKQKSNFSDSRIPVKVREARTTKQDSTRRRDLHSSSETSHYSTTTGPIRVPIRRKKTVKSKLQTVNNAFSGLALNVKKNTEKRHIPKFNYNKMKEVGIHCSISRNKFPLIKPEKQDKGNITIAALRSAPSSIKTDSEMLTPKSSKSKSSWKILKKPPDFQTSSYSAVENNLSNTLRCSEVSFPSTEIKCYTQHSPNVFVRHALTNEKKEAEKAIYGQIIKHISEAKQQKPETGKTSMGEPAETIDKTVGFSNETYVMEESSPHRAQRYKPEVPKPKSFIEEHKALCSRIRNYKIKANTEINRNAEVPKPMIPPNAIGSSRFISPKNYETSVGNYNQKQQEKDNNLSVITSKSEISMPNIDKSKDCSKVNSIITLESFSISRPLISRYNTPRKDRRSRSFSCQRGRLANSNASSLFLTKDYKGNAPLSSYQKRMIYDKNIKRLLKIRSQSRENKCVVPPQVFEVRYVTVTTGNLDKNGTQYVTRSTQNTAEQGCQVSNNTSAETVDKTKPTLGKIKHCPKNEEPPENYCSLVFNNYLPDDPNEAFLSGGGCSGNCTPPRKLFREEKNEPSKKRVHKKKSRRKVHANKHTENRFQGNKLQKHIKRHSKTISDILRGGLPEGKISFDKCNENPTTILWDPKDNLVQKAFKCAANISDYKKSLLRSLTFPYSYINQLQEDRKRIAFDAGTADVEAKNDTNHSTGCSFKGVGNFCTALLCCCCLQDCNRSPKKRKRNSTSMKRSKKRKMKHSEKPENVENEDEKVTQNFRVQINKAVKTSDSSKEVNIILSDVRKNRHQKKLNADCHQNYRNSDNKIFEKVSPVEWFKNLSNFVYMERNVCECGENLLNKKFKSSKEHSFKFPLCRGSISNLTLKSDNTFILKSQLCRSQSEILRKKVAHEHGSSSISLQRSISLTTGSSYTIKTSNNDLDLWLDGMRSIESDSLNQDSSKTNREVNENINISPDKPIELLSENPANFEEQLDMLLFDLKGSNGPSSEESGYTSLISKKSVPGNFFKRRSIMELFKFPLEKKKSKNIIDCSLADHYTKNDRMKFDNKSAGDFLMHESSMGTDDCFRMNFLNKMTKDCQLYAHKIRVLADKRRDGLYEENDNFKEISLDVLLGRPLKSTKEKASPRLSVGTQSDALSPIQVTERSTITEETSVIDLEVIPESEISLPSITEDTYLSCNDDELKSLSLLAEDDRTESVSSKCRDLTKASKSHGDISFKTRFSDVDDDHDIFVFSTRSDSCMGRKYGVKTENFNGFSVEDFKQNSPGNASDRSFFQKLLNLYEREYEILEKLYQDEVFFSDQLQLIEKSKKEGTKTKSKSRFRNIFKLKKKNANQSKHDGPDFFKAKDVHGMESLNGILEAYLDKDSSSQGESISLIEENVTPHLQADSTTRECFKMLAGKVKQNLTPLIKAVSSNKFMNDDLKLSGFVNLLEEIESGDTSMLQCSDDSSLEERVKGQVKQSLSIIYNVAKEAAKRQKTKLSQGQLNIIKSFVTKYRSNCLQPHLETVGSYIGRGAITSEKQLKAALTYLIHLNKEDLSLETFEKILNSV